VSQAPLSEADQAAVRAMNAAMHRRGPDGEGYFQDAHCMLAMRRLAIIDLTGGWQPLYNEDKSIALVANGEVYNYVELRSELMARGHQPRTKSDCELPAHLYEEKGDAFVHDLRGMYAIALWDTRAQRLTLVRDRIGEKPLYLFERTLPGGDKQLWFSSEMRSLIASGLINLELDPAAIDEYMHFHWVHDPRTIVKGVRKLRAGSMMSIEPRTWKVNERVYWRLEDAPAIDAEPGPTIRAELDRVSELIIRSEVPVGVALSGGIDSSTVACLAASKYPGMMKAFSIGWTGSPAQDERSQARALAERLGMPFVQVEIAPEEAAMFFSEVAVVRDDPIADITGYAYYALSKLSREHGCPVLLQGHGGDELFWGYPWHQRALLETIYKMEHGATRPTPIGDRWLPRGLSRPALVEWAQRVGGYLHGWRNLSLPHNTDLDRIVYWDTHQSYQAGDWAQKNIYTKDFAALLAGKPTDQLLMYPQPRIDLEILYTKLQVEGYLLENGINQGDRLSMANSVELRLPLIDYKLAETVIGLRKARPGDFRLGTKAWLRDAVKDVVPEEIFTRPKRGFNPPATKWTAMLRQKHGDALRDGVLVQSGILDRQAAIRMSAPASRLSAWNTLFVTALNLELWAEGMRDIAKGTRSARASLLPGR
jgi:asparagine synthase (glutamine-hydrolysing)